MKQNSFVVYKNNRKIFKSLDVIKDIEVIKGIKVSLEDTNDEDVKILLIKDKEKERKTVLYLSQLNELISIKLDNEFDVDSINSDKLLIFNALLFKYGLGLNKRTLTEEELIKRKREKNKLFKYELGGFKFSFIYSEYEKESKKFSIVHRYNFNKPEQYDNELCIQFIKELDKNMADLNLIKNARFLIL